MVLLERILFLHRLLYKHQDVLKNPLILHSTHLDKAFLDNCVSLFLIRHSGALHWQAEDYYTASASCGTRPHRLHCMVPTPPTLSGPHELEIK